VTADGGGFAAFGFRYQYLAAADHILQQLIEHDGGVSQLALVVEPTRLEDVADGDADEVVDYAVTGGDAVVDDRVQVKASKSDRRRDCSAQ
jgi:hypothetical protein